MPLNSCFISIQTNLTPSMIARYAFVERVGAEAKANDLPLFLELVSYDGTLNETGTAAWAKVKPDKVIKITKGIQQNHSTMSLF